IDSASNRTGKPLTGRQMAGLLAHQARVRGGTVEVTAPDGRLLSMERARVELEAVAGRPLVLRDQHGANYDDSHLLLVNLASIDRLAAEHGSALDRRRFRANAYLAGLEVDGEYAWLGRSLRLGSAVVAAVKMCERCVMITIDPDDQSSDPGILRTLTRTHHALLGVYCKVLTPGVIRLGDSVEVV
ncbi:MAG: MOSC domain-containing protein, partial [Candidatus Dormibacteraeota bacterium]|nr:MOSC domain-containing protein [Candidatus Dormibacteraeota bacterium]